MLATIRAVHAPPRSPRPRRLWLIGVLALATSCGSGGNAGRADATEKGSSVTATTATTSAPPVRRVVRKRLLTLVDRRRVVRRRDGSTAPRRIVVVVRYVALVSGQTQRPQRLPLVVFGHGYGLMPEQYRSLLYRWASAGYVVAAPVFPGENAAAPGGPDRSDLLNEPADVRFVIARLVAEATGRRGVVGRAIDPSRIAVAGHSDGGDTALAVAYDPRMRSRRVDAAVILAGADLPGVSPFAFPADGPPLLAVQGSADPVNPPGDTEAYYHRAPSPKFLLTLLGAGHFTPYMQRGAQLSLVERVTTAFLDRTLKDRPTSTRQILRIGRRKGIARMQAGAGT